MSAPASSTVIISQGSIPLQVVSVTETSVGMSGQLISASRPSSKVKVMLSETGVYTGASHATEEQSWLCVAL